jgi:dipeptidyl aminopeptidase/acylaminoacyl peptidase
MKKNEPLLSPYGSWKTPVTAALLAASNILVSEPAMEMEEFYWMEARPKEGGRYVVVHLRGARIDELTPRGFNVRTTVHEYGGGDYFVHEGKVYFSNYRDQRLYVQGPGSGPRAITPGGVDLRYADGVVDRKRGRIVIVREDHRVRGRQAVNTVVGIDLTEGGPGEVLVSGNDFYSNPRFDPDGSRLAWLTWNHPNMPWDGTELWVGRLGADGRIEQKDMVAGGARESVFQPEWSPDGTLYYVSDRTGWWNLYREGRDGARAEPLHPMKAEFGGPQWEFRPLRYAFEGPDSIVCAYVIEGTSHLGRMDTRTGRLDEVKTPYTEITGVLAWPGHALLVAGSPTETTSIVTVDLETGRTRVLRRSMEKTVDPGYLSGPEPISFPTENGKEAYGFYYPPRNKDFRAPPGERPPLVVMSHGGPTSAVTMTLKYGIQYFTGHGLAVADINYGGSTGFGREYRERLEGNWGVVDVDDCINAARYLVRREDVDGKRVAIMGGSAGGYTTMCAVTFRRFFNAGASFFGISDLEGFDETTHKFESRYNESLLGPYPERKEAYRERSALKYADRVSCPLILFQGLEDRIVPPAQSKKLYEAVKKKGLPTAYVAFKGEQHGFRRAGNIKRSIELELYFYSRVFGFKPADRIKPVRIENLGRE